MKETIIFDPHYDPTEVKFSLTILQEKLVKAWVKRDDMDLRIVVPNENSIHKHIWKGSLEETGKQFWGTDKPTYLGVAHDKFSEASCDKINLSWSKLQNQKDYYVYFTPRIRGAFDLLNALQKGFVFAPTIYLWHIYDHKNQPWFELNRKLRESVANAMVNFRTIFTNQMIYDQWHTMIKQTYSPAIVKKFEGISPIFNLGVDVDLIDQVRAKKKNDVFTWIYGGRITEIKGVHVMLEVVENLNRMSRPCRLELYATIDGDTSSEILQKLEASEFVTIYKNPKDQSVFLEAATRAHGYLTPCKLESYGMSWLEMMYAGAIGVYWEREWQKSVLPENYPYRVKNLSEMTAMAAYVYDNYSEVQTMREPQFKGYVRQEHNTEKSMNAIGDELVLVSKLLRTKEVRDKV